MRLAEIKTESKSHVKVYHPKNGRKMVLQVNRSRVKLDSLQATSLAKGLLQGAHRIGGI